jgi:DNA-binding GntR family transcriptional regulator
VLIASLKHGDIIDACAAGDREAAIAALSRHLQQTAARLRSLEVVAS